MYPQTGFGEINKSSPRSQLLARVVKNWSGAGNMNVATFRFFDVSPEDRRILLSRPSQQGNQSVTLVTTLPRDWRS